MNFIHRLLTTSWCGFKTYCQPQNETSLVTSLYLFRLSSLDKKLWVRIEWWGVLYTQLWDKVFQLLATGWWFSTGAPLSSTNKTDCHDITEILLKVELNTITLNKSCSHDIAENILKVELNTITFNQSCSHDIAENILKVELNTITLPTCRK
jgi:hypothetical protein